MLILYRANSRRGAVFVHQATDVFIFILLKMNVNRSLQKLVVIVPLRSLHRHKNHGCKALEQSHVNSWFNVNGRANTDHLDIPSKYLHLLAHHACDAVASENRQGY
jgi:hypothetical protein